MTIVLLILCSLCVVLIAVSGWLFGKVRIQQLDIEKLYDAVAQAVQDQAKLRFALAEQQDAMQKQAEMIALNGKKIGVLHDKTEEHGENITALNDALENIGDGMGERIEKLWNDGVQSLIAWNPLAEDNGGK
jgi:biopolymer transport protein ExbB/TolQ